MINTKKDKDFILVLSGVLLFSIIFLAVIWGELRYFEKVIFIFTLSTVTVLLIGSLLRNLFVILKRKKPHNFMTQEQLTAKKYKELADRYRELKKELKEVDLQMKIIDRNVGQVYDNRPYMDKIK